MSITAFKCPCCGAGLTFSSENSKMTCEYCGTELDAQAADALSRSSGSSADIEWEEHTESTVYIDGDICVYTCNSCGAEITGDSSLGAAECPYCGSPFVMNDKFEGMLRPDLIIPFKVNKERAVEEFKKFCSNRPLLPSSFMSSHRIESIEGMYVPYWLFDCDADAKINFRGERSITWTEGDYSVTKTDYYLLMRSGSIGFEHVPADGTSKLSKEITEAIEPFGMDGAVDFKAPYLSGYLADRYDISAEERHARANERIRESIESAFMETASDYSPVTTESSDINVKDGKVSYALLPMWLMTAKYNGRLYTFAMNGQTGRFVGELPVSKGRAAAAFAIITAVSAAVITIILKLLGI